jgi:succinate-acetate transporter protein
MPKGNPAARMENPTEYPPLPPVIQVSERLANPAPLGLAAFGLTTLALNAFNAGLVDKSSEGVVWSLAIAFGGIAQFAAGMWEAKKNNTFGFTAFSAFGAFWLFMALTNIFVKTGAIQPLTVGGESLFLVCWGIFAAYLTVATFNISRALQIVFVLLTVLFFGLAIGVHQPNGNFMHVVGWEGMLTAGSALYTSFAILLEETWGRTVLPLGVVRPHAGLVKSEQPDKKLSPSYGGEATGSEAETGGS